MAETFGGPGVGARSPEGRSSFLAEPRRPNIADPSCPANRRSRLRALDLFAGAGGASRGLQLAGLDVTGVDVKPQRHSPADRIIQADALSLSVDFIRGFNFVWASPPCQRHSSMRLMHNAKRHADLIGPTRELLIAAGVPFAIENVEGARPMMRSPVLLCGSMFGLATPCGAGLKRHRLFECSFKVTAPPKCRHRRGTPVIGVYGAHNRNRSRPTGTNHQPKTDFGADDARFAMGVDWPVTGNEISQAIPPAYSEFIARAWLGGARANTKTNSRPAVEGRRPR